MVKATVGTVARAMACAAMLWATPQAMAQANVPCGASADEPCPAGIERLCDQFAGTGHGGGLQLFCECLCGPGFWGPGNEEVVLQPERATSAGSPAERINSTIWSWHRSAYADRTSAQARISMAGHSTFWHAASMTRAANAGYTTQVKEQWFGANPPCPRYVQLAAVGGGILEITLTCSAQSGCSATASASLAGSCSSRGDASATLEDKTVNGTVFYKSASHTVKAEGRLGATADDSSVGIDGKISTQVAWELTGAGAVSGSASYTVRPDRTYCAYTNRPIVRRANGMVVCTGGATVDWNGSASVEALAIVSLWIR
jgi:hypothetical protein